MHDFSWYTFSALGQGEGVVFVLIFTGWMFLRLRLLWCTLRHTCFSHPCFPRVMTSSSSEEAGCMKPVATSLGFPGRLRWLGGKHWLFASVSSSQTSGQRDGGSACFVLKRVARNTALARMRLWGLMLGQQTAAPESTLVLKLPQRPVLMSTAISGWLSK